MAPAFGHVFDHLLHVILPGNIRVDNQDVTTLFLDSAGDYLSSLLVLVHDGHRCAFSSKCDGRGLADSGSCPGYCGYFSPKSHDDLLSWTINSVTTLTSLCFARRGLQTPDFARPTTVRQLSMRVTHRPE